MAEDSNKPPSGGTEVLCEVDDGWQDLPDVLPIQVPHGEARYVIEGELARGTMGVVKVARDVALHRRVALKELRPEGNVPDAAGRFLEEARITAQLQHPGIVAIYEIGESADERPFFTMQLIEGRTLREIIDGLRSETPAFTARYGRIRLVNIFSQVCMAVAYAHARGVIHRDLKPANIMLGEFGEVFVMDWGLAKVVRTDVAQPMADSRAEVRFATRVGDITGTPAYMSPEQAMGLVDALGPATDIYALGAILYELLTLRPAVQANTTQALLAKVRRGAIERPSTAAPEAEVPAELEGVIMRCLSRDPAHRFRSAAEVRDEVEASLDGGHTRTHRIGNTTRNLREAHRTGQVFRDLARRRRRLAREFAEAQADRLPADPPDAVRALWDVHHQLSQQEAELEAAFAQSIAQFDRVLSERPDHQAAHEGLRDLLWYRFLEAERRGDRAAMSLFGALAAQHDPRGTLGAAVEGNGTLTLTSDPPGLAVRLRTWAPGPRAEALALGPPTDCGTTPLRLEPLAMGSYMLEIEHDTGLTTIALAQGRQSVNELSVRPLNPLPEGCVHVPAGPFWSGADNRIAAGARPRSRGYQADALISRTPVTLGAYADFLAHLVQSGDASGARRHVPPSGFRLAPDGRWYPEGHTQTPVTAITAVQAEAYCAWRAQRDGLPWRLPTASEWEKAARGVDGRSYPWGDGWEPSRCRCAEGPEGGAASPVGNPDDESPFGLRDLAGGVREWTGTAHPRDARRRILKGGGFNSRQAACHLAARAVLRVDHSAEDVGFRLALDFEPLWLAQAGAR
jgi:serine/threonine-protein kinase